MNLWYLGDKWGNNKTSMCYTKVSNNKNISNLKENEFKRIVLCKQHHGIDSNYISLKLNLGI